MKKEDKEILLRDLSTGLSYGVIVEIISYGQEALMPWFGKLSCKDLDCFIHDVAYKSIKPYLRPMDSMTEEEKWDFGRIFNTFGDLNLDLLEDGLCFQELYDITGKCNITWDELNTAINWLNSHHFDYRGLIEKGLALEATKDMYNL